MAGTYDAGGVITGTTARAGFQGTDSGQLATAIANGTDGGILTGLIGAQGAVGVFISASDIGKVDGSTKDNIKVRPGTSVAYFGGFIAAPYVSAEDDDADKVTFRDWLREFDYPLHTSPAVADARTTSNSYFIKPKADGTLDLTGVKSTADRNVMAVPYTATRAGDVNDGFVYAIGIIPSPSAPAGISQTFVGILPSTDLGAPLTEAIAIAKWPGKFSLGNSATLNDIEFTLTFDGMNSGTINGEVGAVRFNLVFDGKGIVTGDVTYSSLNAITSARGLIGEEGLVGVFAETNVGNLTAFGGFVAAPPADHAAHLASFSASPLPTTRTTDTTAFGGFLNLAPSTTAIDATGLKTMTTTVISGGGTDAPAVSLSLTREGSTADGVVYIGGFNGDSGQAFVGLLPTTNLGAPFPIMSDTRVEWVGNYYDSIDGLRSGIFRFNVDFEGRSISATLSSINPDTPDFDLDFDDAGLITGTVTKNSMVATAHGLIGAEGLVGVFVDITPPTAGAVFHGGFVAQPNSE